MNQPLLIQQMLGCSLLQALEPKSRAVAQFRKRSQKNLSFIRALLPEQLTEQRWERYFSDIINRSENEAIESLMDEGYVPQGKAESWLENILGESAKTSRSYEDTPDSGPNSGPCLPE